MKYYYLRAIYALSLFLLIGANVTAQPVINSDYRYVRGSTMALVRMVFTSNGATITERGVCVSETEEPTVNDIKANQETQLTNKGPMYWLKGLQPATKYYMRGFVITNNGQTIYGESKKFYTLPQGQITFSMRTSGDSDSERIRAAAQTAIDWWNAFTEMKGFSPSIGYNSGVPTAECSYGGWMSVGSNQSYQRCGTIMHEMLHGIGVIPWADTEWSRHNLRSGVNGDGYGTGQWLGDRVTEVLTFLENTETHLNGDYQHMWPYGINGAGEDNGSNLLYMGNAIVCQALGEDGLQHTSTCFAQPYYSLEQEDTTKFYIKNESQDRGRYTSYLMPKPDGGLQLVEMSSTEALANDSAAWTTTFTPNNQFYQIRNVATGRYITFNGTNFTTVERTKATNAENLQLMKGRVDVDGQRGYWLIQPASNWSPKCLNAFANGNIAAQTFNIANDAESQRWLMLTSEELKAIEVVAMKEMKTVIATLLNQAKALLDVPHKEDVAGADSDFETLLSDIETRSNQAATPIELIAITEDAQKAGLKFLGKVTVTNPATPFNLTYLMTNPDIDTNTDGWSQSATVNYSCAEFYQTTFDFKQDLSGMPAGTYQLSMQGFQRPGSSADSYNAFVEGRNEVNAELYAGEKSKKIAHIATGARTSTIGGGTEATVGSGYYIPNNMQAASLYFKKKIYDNHLYSSLNEEGALTVGLRSTSMPSNYWVIFDNFRLYFYGKMTEDEILDVDAITSNNNDRPRKIYTIDGRQLSPNVSLRPGLYIIDGRKVLVK